MMPMALTHTSETHPGNYCSGKYHQQKMTLIMPVAVFNATDVTVLERQKSNRRTPCLTSEADFRLWAGRRDACIGRAHGSQFSRHIQRRAALPVAQFPFNLETQRGPD
jgi:hypothetical protein